jgi:hypothetical protein
MMVTTMGIPSIATFEVEAVESDFKIWRRQILRRLEKLKQLFRGKSSKVVELPSIRLSYEGISTVTFIETKPTVCTCPNLLNLQIMPKMEGGWSLPPKGKGGGYMDRGPPSQCKLCGEVGHQVIGCYYHLSILDGEVVPNWKN